MELLPAELRAVLPRLYAQEKSPDPIVYAKFFLPNTRWTWFVTEGGPEDDDFLLFSYVIGLEEEWGYVSLNELTAVRDPLFRRLPVERDLDFKPAPFSEVMKRHRQEHGQS